MAVLKLFANVTLLMQMEGTAKKLLVRYSTGKNPERFMAIKILKKTFFEKYQKNILLTEALDVEKRRKFTVQMVFFVRTFF